MGTNKHATIRYHALDQCFSNPGRKYFIEDLIEACNNALYEFTGITNGVKKRQIFDDINFMESEQGWSIPLDRIKDGRRTYYRYYDKNFSIKNQLINETEANQLEETLSILSRFNGMPQFDWIKELSVRIASTFNLKATNTPIVSFEHNPYLKGLNFFTDLFNSINYKNVLNITYQSFNAEKPFIIYLHPYYLKQYNNRWFLFGLNESTNSISNLAFDRIIEIKETNKQFIENQTIDFDEYFEDIIGVTVLENQKEDKILLKIDNKLFPYIDNKPIHGSQIVKERNSKETLIELTLKINYEFISLLLSYGEQITVLAPEDLKTIIKTKAKKVFEKYI